MSSPTLKSKLSHSLVVGNLKTNLLHDALLDAHRGSVRFRFRKKLHPEFFKRLLHTHAGFKVPLFLVLLSGQLNAC